MFRRSWLAAAVVSAVVAAGATAAENTKPDVFTFGSLKSVTADAARTQALEWLKASGKADDATRATETKRLEGIIANDCKVAQ